eukprot:CAMPEP_0202833524 /NCGR_PEP_ID=MMETSP1389-20130828/26048_1 /ASSEMBLY_ACC=CAM_ASM_000865 /TAXON_ID=302021 /ORGANISM="Rhodomonas sp., Strain CCMP768" /LENGTH=111 /DNA_ID=CAMNT_0049508225 /DNA_START=125 /DNA_END=457 /DNA_ORIENTATION=+
MHTRSFPQAKDQVRARTAAIHDPTRALHFGPPRQVSSVGWTEGAAEGAAGGLKEEAHQLRHRQRRRRPLHRLAEPLLQHAPAVHAGECADEVGGGLVAGVLDWHDHDERDR